MAGNKRQTQTHTHTNTDSQLGEKTTNQQIQTNKGYTGVYSISIVLRCGHGVLLAPTWPAAARDA